MPTPPPSSQVVVPPDIQAKFPVLVALILQSQSMNDEERKYWIMMLPTMTDDHRASLEEILKNEQAQLKAIDAKYHDVLEKKNAATASGANIEQSRRKKRSQRMKKEEEFEREDETKSAALLKEIEEEQ
jgi:hypothetical protein